MKIKLSKQSKREMMKSLLILEVSAEMASKLLEFTNVPFAGIAVGASYGSRIAQIKATSAKLFRHDKPKLDKRRVKRNNKGSKLVRINYLTESA